MVENELVLVFEYDEEISAQKRGRNTGFEKENNVIYY